MAEIPHRTSEHKEPHCHRSETSAAPGDLPPPHPDRYTQMSKMLLQEVIKLYCRKSKEDNAHLFVKVYYPKSVGRGNWSSRFPYCLQKTLEGPV